MINMFKIAKNSLLNCSSKSLITGRGSNSFVYILVLWLWIVLFFSTFIFSLLPPQYGWWNYYGWQISEGAVLYKDLYCFLAPYYVWLSAFLYRIFGNNILVYYCIGICFDGIAAACVFKLLRRGVSPVWALTFTVAGAILQYSYLMYLPLDYNVFIADIVVIALYMIVIGLFDQKQRFLIYGGFLLGFASMMKQTLLLVAVISGATIFVVSRLIFSSQIGKKNLIKFSIGFIVSVGPGIIALVMTDTMGLLYSLIIEAGGSKGSITGIVYRFFSLGFPYGVFILSLVMALYLISPYTQFIKTTFLKKLNKMPYLKELLIFDLFLLFLKKICYLSNYKVILFLSLLYWILCLQKRKSIDKVKSWINYKSIFFDLYNNGFLLTFIIGTSIILLSTYFGFEFRKELIFQHNLFGVKRSLVEFVFWVLFICSSWIFVQIFFQNKTQYITHENIFCLVYVSFVSMHFLSTAWMEEIYIMPIFAMFMAMVLRRVEIKWYNNLLKGISVVIMSFIVVISITQKQITPYSWWGWKSIGLDNPDKEYVKSEIPGLIGFVFDVSTEEAYENIIDAINIYSSSEDKVFNFPHIPLFNVLTKRSSGMKAVAYYFDVCPDIIAKDAAKKLNNYPPQIVIWNEFGPEIWDYNEKVFRNGKRSGQRDILDWYNNTVHKEYEMIYRYYTLSVWVKKVENFDNLRFANIWLQKKLRFNFTGNNKNLITYLKLLDWQKYDDIINSSQKYSVEKCIKIIIDRENCFKERDELRQQKFL